MRVRRLKAASTVLDGLEKIVSERKIMLLLSALHKRGFERLRLSAGIELHWRYEIAPATSFNPDGATVKHGLYACGAAGSSNGKLPPFDWEGAEAATLEASKVPFIP